MSRARSLVVVLAVLASTFLVGPGPSSAAGGEAPMTERRAGAYYTNHVCPVNLAADRYSRQVWRGRDSITMRELRRRLPEIRRYAPPYARAVYGWARDLLNPPADWPDDVARLVQRMAEISLRHSELLWLQSEAGSARRWSNLNARINDLPSTRPAVIRARLNLPRMTRCRT